MHVLNEQHSGCLLLGDCTNPEEITSSRRKKGPTSFSKSLKKQLRLLSN